MTNTEAIETLYKWAMKYANLKQYSEDTTRIEEAKRQLDANYFTLNTSDNSYFTISTADTTFNTFEWPEFYSTTDYTVSYTYVDTTTKEN